MNQTLIEIPRPILKEPFPGVPRYWICPKTGLRVPKLLQENIEWRSSLLQKAEKDILLQRDLLAACKASQLFWINAFCWTFHQFDEDPITGMRFESKHPHMPFVTWDIQDELTTAFELSLKKPEDILIDKSRKMGASWCCVNFLHWLWLFDANSQLLEMSRTREYVDQPGNMKALFQKHDYINEWLPDWMRPEGCLPGEYNRTKMHMKNAWNGSAIDGESTTEHAARGDRRKVGLLDEFSMVEYGDKMLTATRDACLMRIINSTVCGAGTAYSRLKNSGRIKVFVMPFYESPEMGAGRYVSQTDNGGYEIRSPYFDAEVKVRSPKEIATELLRQDIESGERFFTTHNIDNHKAMYSKEPLTIWNIALKPSIAKAAIRGIIRSKSQDSYTLSKAANGNLRVWVPLILGRPDQSKAYIFGIDLGKGQGASNSVISIKCKETGEKIAEWASATVPPYDMAYTAIALALWCGGRKPHNLPFFKWEMNGPGWDFGRIIVKEFFYPYFHRNVMPGKMVDEKTDNYGWHNHRQSKFELLSLYDRFLAHGGYINHSKEALEEAKYYVHLTDGGIGPAFLIEESSSAKKTHGDRVMADALTLDDSDIPKHAKFDDDVIPERSPGYRIQQEINKRKRKEKSWRRPYDFSRSI